MDGTARNLGRETGPALEAHYRFIMWLVPTMERFPRRQSFLLGDRIQGNALDVLESLVEATYTRQRRPYLRRARRFDPPRYAKEKSMQRPMTILWVLLVSLFAWLAVAYADTLTVTVSRASVRQGPGLTHGVVTTVPRGATFPVLSTQGDWHRILLDDGRGAWIAATTVRLDASGRALQRVEPTSQRRVALVIGNAAYADSPSRNPVNDATDMAAALRQLGFEVTLLRDARRRQMNDAVRAFGRRLRQGGVGLFYFAGHGLQVAG